jgi:glycine cleavage system aminomethyltransferase T
VSGSSFQAVTATRGEFASFTIADRVRQAGGVMVLRDGRPVAGNFGSAATELAVCVKRVGLAVRADLDAIELIGAEAWLSRFLAEALDGRVPSPGHAVRAGGTWCCRVAPDSAVVVGSWSAAARWARIAREAIVTGAAIGCTDRSGTASALTLVGPRAERLLSDAGLPELPVAGVSESWWAGGPVLVLREAADRFLLLVDAEHAVDAWQELFDLGRALGLSMVGTEALERLAAAPRAFARD